VQAGSGTSFFVWDQCGTRHSSDVSVSSGNTYAGGVQPCLGPPVHDTTRLGRGGGRPAARAKGLCRSPCPRPARARPGEVCCVKVKVALCAARARAAHTAADTLTHIPSPYCHRTYTRFILLIYFTAA
jgi:hypothetical protein